MMFPILESRKYVDYKEPDLTHVKNIPFILTYTTSLSLCIPFAIESKGEKNNRVLFSNVISALSLNPSHITYMIDTDDFIDNPERFKKALDFAMLTMDSRKMQTKISLVFLRNKQISLSYDDLITVKQFSPRIGNIELIEYANDEELDRRLHEFFETNRRSRRCFSAIEKNATGTSKLLRGFGCCKKYPTYAVNPIEEKNTVRFLTENGCEYFNYIRFDDQLLISELFAAQKIIGGTKPPELPDYEIFWRLYRTQDPNDTHSKNEKVWKSLCGVLGSYTESHDRLGKIEISKNDDIEARPHSFLIPSLCYTGAREILKKIAALHPRCLGESPTLKYCTSDTCEVSVICTQDTFRALGDIFSNPYYLSEPDKLRVEKRFENGGIWAVVYFDNLMVTDLSVRELREAFPGREERPMQILLTLHKAGKLVALRHDEKTDTLSFCYASSRIKEVMTCEGKILELYVYYKALEENYFDDIVCSYTISDEDHVSNEFDLILTKGFRTVIVECKACPTLEQAFYHKLAGLNRQYGVNSTAVLVADTLEKPWWDTEANDMQRTRGRQFNVYTIYKHEDIMDIGKKLREIMEQCGV